MQCGQYRLNLKRGLYRAAVGFVVLCLSACVSPGGHRGSVMEIPPLQIDGEYEFATATPSSPDQLLALTDEMKAFSERYVSSGRSQRQRLNSLHASLRSDAMLGIEYEPGADGTAAEAFHSGLANCLSYAHLFVAMARYNGLDARYQSLSLRPQWTRHGDRISVRRHVNVVVRLRGGEEFMVDIDPVQRSRVTRADTLSDGDAAALYDNNMAMDSLFRDDLNAAYSSAVVAVRQSPQIDYLWVNLGAIFSRSGQLGAAEQAYMQALELNPESDSAMNNLVILYAEMGDQLRAEQWAQKIERYRQINPYYHALLGEQAVAEGDLPAALEHYQAAVRLKDADAELYFQLGKLYVDLNQLTEGVRYLRLAVEHSTLISERKSYQSFLDRVSADYVAHF